MGLGRGCTPIEKEGIGGMLAAVFEGEGKLVLKDVPEPKITKPDEVLIEVEMAGICGTDVHILSVPPGHPATPGVILGHEYVGTVIEKGSEVTNVEVGDRVVIDPNLTCGVCRYCRRGMPNMCENFTTLGIFLNGGFAKYNVAPARAVYKISKDVPLKRAALAEPLSCVVNGISKLDWLVGRNVVILGAGPIGLLFLMMFRAQGAGKTIILELAEYRINKAKELGADIVVNPKEEDAKRIVLQETGGLGADIVVDAVGSLLPNALELVRHGGTVLLFGMNQNARPQVQQFAITRYEVKVLGTYISLFSFPSTVAVLESGKVELERMVTHVLELKDIREGIELMRRGEAIKILVKP